MSEDAKRQQELDLQVRALRERKDQEAWLALIMMFLVGFGRDQESKDALASSIKPEDVTEERITAHPLFLGHHPEYRKESAAHTESFNSAATGQTSPRPSIFSHSNTLDTALRTAVSIGIENYTDDCIKRGVKYGFGTKDGKNAIDCSGFVSEAVRSILATTGMADKKDVMRIFANHSDGQIQALAQRTGLKLEGADIKMSNLKAGMVLAIDSGHKKWDGGRQDGIDHTGIIFADKETGRLMFAESRGGVGVMVTPLDEYLEKAKQKGWNLFAADVVKLATDEHKSTVEASLRDPSVRVAGIKAAPVG